MLENHPRVRSNRKQREFVLVTEEERGGNPALVMTQKDVRELQLAKAAIRSGIQLLLEAKDCPEEKIDQVIIAGAFGSYIDVSSAVTIGMLPSLPLQRFVQVGNAAGMGAKLALISSSKRTEAQDIALKAHYLELTTVPIFMQTFIQANYLGRYRMTKGKKGNRLMETKVSSTKKEVVMGEGYPTVLIGERINPAGKKKMADALRAGNLEVVQNEALSQVQAGADIIDINVTLFGMDEVILLPQAVEAVMKVVDVPLCFDSPNPRA
jgi:hypothetical protein